MKSTDIQKHIDRAVGTDGTLRIPSWWMHKILSDLVKYCEGMDNSETINELRSYLASALEELGVKDSKLSEDIDALGSKVSELESRELFLIVDGLPEAGNDNTIYLVPSETGEGNNILTEWVYLNGSWEQFGEFKADVDLSEYAKKAEIPTKVSELEMDVEIGSLTAEEVASTEPTAAFPQLLYTEQLLTEEQKSQARTNIGVNDAIEEAIAELPAPESSVFEAEYNKTTFAEIVEAYNAGKSVTCRYGQTIAQLISITDSVIYFTSINIKREVRFICYSSNLWNYNDHNTAHELEDLDNGNVQVTIAGNTAEVATPQYVDNAIQQSGTPSGDPMHYMYVTAGAEYNDTGADIERQGIYGDTIVWKNGYWWLNELGDITNEEIRTIYTCWKKTMDWAAYAPINGNFPIRTNFPFLGLPAMGFVGQAKVGSSQVFQSNLTIVKASVFWPKDWYGYHNLSELFAYCYSLETIIGVLGAASYELAEGMFRGCLALKDVQITHLKQAISFVSSSKLSNASILYMIENEAATSAIVITLHADAYARAMADETITTALEAHPNVSLASA